MTLTAQPGTANAVTVTFSTTKAAAQRLGVRPQTLRAGVCRDGHYLGIRPAKKKNRMLSWPDDQVDRVAAGLPPQEPTSGGQ